MVHLPAEEIFRRLGVAAGPALALMAQLRPDTPSDWRALAAGLTGYFSPPQHSPQILGVAGGQGAGKSTLSNLLGQALTLTGRRVLVLSLDDFYLTRAERQRLAQRQHPLLLTRGVPGTHDIARLADTLAAVVRPGRHALPVFDKGRDDRLPEPVWFEGPAELVVLEGWCVGAPPEPESRLREPINALERDEDPQGIWRAYVNGALAAGYADVWRQLECLLYLAVPDLAAVRRWRGQQEQERPETVRMNAQQIERFVAHYERLTLWMRETLTESAQIVGFLDADHQLQALQLRA